MNTIDTIDTIDTDNTGTIADAADAADLRRLVRDFDPAGTEETADGIVSRFFNRPSEIDPEGDVWSGHWASAQQVSELVEWLKDNNHL